MGNPNENFLRQTSKDYDTSFDFVKMTYRQSKDYGEFYEKMELTLETSY